MNDKKILDACCGSKMFWFDKEYKDAVYIDNRTEDTTLCDGRRLIVRPDIEADFRNMPYSDETFYLVIFDPPHLIRAGEKVIFKNKIWKIKYRVERRYKKRLSRMLESP